MEGASEIQSAPRGTLARIGITLLNILQPGLGLLRLAKVKPALGYVVAQLSVGCLLLLCYVFAPTWTYTGWISIVSVAIVITLALYGGSMVMTWRSSRQVQSRAGWLWRWYAVIAVWLGILAVTSPVSSAAQSYYRNFSMPAASMAPMLQIGDRFVAKMHGFAPLRRGDVVIVSKGSTEYVKRIVAIPGDRITLAGGRIILNGREIAQREVEKTRVDYDGRSRAAALLEEQLPGEAQPHQIIDLGETPQDDWPGVVLTQDQFVLMGDNRDNSLDSRFAEADGGLGIVSRSRIRGRALFRYWRDSTGLGEGAI